MKQQDANIQDVSIHWVHWFHRQGFLPCRGSVEWVNKIPFSCFLLFLSSQWVEKETELNTQVIHRALPCWPNKNHHKPTGSSATFYARLQVLSFFTDHCSLNTYPNKSWSKRILSLTTGVDDIKMLSDAWVTRISKFIGAGIYAATSFPVTALDHELESNSRLTL